MKSIRLWTALCILLPALGVLAACPGPALAQAQGQKTGSVTTASTPVDEWQLKDLTEKLNLTEDQQAKIKAVLDDQQQQSQTAMQGDTLSREDKLSQVRRTNVSTTSKIRELLTDEQKIKFDQMEKERRDRMRQESGAGQSSPK